MRVVIKGGVWKNTEDEILKAAISKYGKNQWARISSLLVRKTPKQCKARWMEWLDPAIKKTEWSKEEDEKLLHLAKLMPTQWRTIAPIVGRTANQCLERYQKLLDEAERAENDELGLAGVDDAGPSADDVRRLRPGEVDPDPENRPARPDPIDMDEDEKEMLSEARARLANTQGKKAKRKARERQLEEARRLAILQKKRELKAAGILMRAKPKKNGMDYMADIPFEKQPAAGFYDTSVEQSKRVSAPTGKTLRELEGGKRKQDREEDDRREKKRKAREAKDKDADAMSHFVPSKDALLQQRREEQQISKRRKLVLPTPQVSERELEDLVKVGRAGESARAMVDESGNEASQGLLGEYSALGDAKNARTPRTAPQHDNVMAEARNLRNLTAQQTPLLGEENTPMHELHGRTGFEAATPRGQVAATPNPLATPFRSGASDVSATPVSTVGATPLRTPMRDSLSINDENASQYGVTPREERHRLNDVKRQLRAGFSALPQPKNEFELVLPEEEEEAAESAEVSEAMRIEDRTEREAKLKAIKEAEEKAELERRSQAVKRGLPRPAEVDAAALLAQLDLEAQDSDAPAADKDDKARREAERLVTIEMIRLLEHDATLYPPPGSKRAGGGKSTLPRIADDELAAARKAVHDEIAQAVGLPGASEAVLKRTVILQAEDFDKVWRPTYERLAYDAGTDRYVEKETLSDGQRIAGLRALIESNRDKMASESAKAAKQEKRLGQLLGGYVARGKTLAAKLTENYDELSRTRVELESFARLALNEDGAMVRRTEGLREEVDKLERKERDGQMRFKELLDLKEQLEREVQDMELQEAELINRLNTCTNSYSVHLDPYIHPPSLQLLPLVLHAPSSSTRLKMLDFGLPTSLDGLSRSIFVIISSEIGDKTFLIAAILSMRHPRVTVFAAAFSALAVMSFLSALLGTIVPTLLPKRWTTVAAAVLFFVFGAKMLQEGLEMEAGEKGREKMEEEMREVQKEVEEAEEEATGRPTAVALDDMEEGHGRAAAAGSEEGLPQPATSRARSGSVSKAKDHAIGQISDGVKNLAQLLFSPIFIQAFILTFLAEWGDRSQITTIALAAAHNVWIVTFGTTLGHCVCTGMAVIGGRWVSQHISIKHVTLGGAVLFLIFGLIYSYEAWNYVEEVLPAGLA
ncbi:hypothetical protein JCM8097_004815 [Rhodosporidiobolus ruineniae]